MDRAGVTYYEVGAPLSISDTAYTQGTVRVPRATTLAQTQRETREEDPDYIAERHYSPLGMPRTSEAWAIQDAIDQGALHRTYIYRMIATMPVTRQQALANELVGHHPTWPGLVQAVDGTLSDVAQGQAFPSLDHRSFTAFAEAIQGTNAALGFYSQDLISRREASLYREGDTYAAFQEGIVDAYMAQASAAQECGAMLFDLLPTATDLPTRLSQLFGPDEFRPTHDVHKIRYSSVAVAEQLRNQGQQTFGLAVPYANSVENIVAPRNFGVPTDGSAHLHRYSQALDPSVTSVASGYSQGGAAVLDYALDRRGVYPDRTQLDYALALAPMGGADARGAHGVHAGLVGNTQLLSIAHEADPARFIHTGGGLVDLRENSGDFVESALDFTRPDGHPDKRGYGELHSGYRANDPQAGTYGYPSSRFLEWTDALFQGDYARQGYTRMRDWNYDERPLELREEAERVRQQVLEEKAQERERRRRRQRLRRLRGG